MNTLTNAELRQAIQDAIEATVGQDPDVVNMMKDRLRVLLVAERARLERAPAPSGALMYLGFLDQQEAKAFIKALGDEWRPLNSADLEGNRAISAGVYWIAAGVGSLRACIHNAAVPKGEIKRALAVAVRR